MTETVYVLEARTCEEGEWLTVSRHESGKDAGDAMRTQKADAPASYKFRIRQETTGDWRAECREKIDTGVWITHPFARESACKEDWFLHHAINKRENVAWVHRVDNGTPKVRSASFRSFLSWAFPDASASELRPWIAQYDASCVEILTSAAEIVGAYKNGPCSCMSKSEARYDSGVHPCAVYGTDDGADIDLAILRDGETIRARTLVWREKRVHNLVYGMDGDDTAKLTTELERLGYEPGSFDGATLRRIKASSELVLPYLDRWYVRYTPCGVDDCGDYLVWRDQNYELLGDNQDGIATRGGECPDCGRITFNNDGTTTDRGTLCPDCAEDYRECCCCGAAEHIDNMTVFACNFYCETHAEEQLTECDCCGDTVHREDVSQTQDGDTVCDCCVDAGYYTLCLECGDLVRREEMVAAPNNVSEDDEVCRSCCRAALTVDTDWSVR